MENEIDYENPENEYQDEAPSDELVENQDQPEENEIHASSDDFDDENHQEQENVKPQKIDIRERLSQVQRERYQILQEAEALRQENELLRKSAEISAGQALNQYDENLSRRYENARAAKAKALEEGDIQSQIDADSELAMVSAEMFQTNFLKAQNNLQANQYQRPSVQNQDNSYHAVQWLQENQWFSPHSEEFDPGLAQEVDNYINAFDSNLYRNGQGSLINSPEYLNIISQYASSLMNNRNQNGNKRELNMRQSRSPISPVRNGYGQGITQRQKVQASQAEKDLARRLGLKETEYLQYKVRDQKLQKEKMMSRGGR